MNAAWPPSYTIKKHRRAKRVKLRASEKHGLEITVPYRFNMAEIPAILSENKSWIHKQLLRLAAKQVTELPQEIQVQALDATWKVNYLPCQAKLELIHRPQGEIVLVGEQDKNKCKALLMVWLKHQAKQHLIPHLQAISHAVQLPYESVTVRNQETLWGSCTSKKKYQFEL